MEDQEFLEEEDPRDRERREHPDPSRKMSDFQRLGQVVGSPGLSPSWLTLEKTKIECICRVCGEGFPGSVTMHGDKERPWSRSNLCPRCEAIQVDEEKSRAALERYQEREYWKRHCGIPRSHWDKTFDNYKTKKRSIVKALFDWTANFPTESSDYPSIILFGEENGLGKTHLAAAVQIMLIDIWPYRHCPTRMISGPALLDRFYESYQARALESKADILRDLRSIRLLVLDDVGKNEKIGDHTRGTYYEIIADRIDCGWPVIITTNLPLEPIQNERSLVDLMGKATVSRLVGMSRTNYFELKGPDWRKKRLQV